MSSRPVTDTGPEVGPGLDAVPAKPGLSHRQSLAGLWLWLAPLFLCAAVLHLVPSIHREVELVLVAWTLLFSIVVHELGHAWMARLEGDDTGLKLGRLSWRPGHHYDPVGSVLAPLATGFLTWVLGSGLVVGWARPIPVDPSRFDSPARSPLRVALAGPLANFGLLYLTMVATTLVILARGHQGIATDLLPIEWLSKPIVDPTEAGFFVVLTVARWSLLFNALLAVVNLIPVPPFDGARILAGLTPSRWRAKLRRGQRWALGAAPLVLALGQTALLLWPVAFLWYAALLPIGYLTGAPLPELFS